MFKKVKDAETKVNSLSTKDFFDGQPEEEEVDQGSEYLTPETIKDYIELKLDKEAFLKEYFPIFSNTPSEVIASPNVTTSIKAAATSKEVYCLISPILNLPEGSNIESCIITLEAGHLAKVTITALEEAYDADARAGVKREFRTQTNNIVLDDK